MKKSVIFTYNKYNKRNFSKRDLMITKKYILKCMEQT